MTTTTDPDSVRHPDPAVQALINGAWLGRWDEPITVGDLVSAVNTVRTTDRRAAGTAQVNRISPVDLSMLIGRHTPVRPDPCRVCGADMTIGSMGGGDATVYRCSVASANYFNPTNRAETEDHYRRSEQRITYHGDHAIVAALLELRALREAAGEDMAVPVGAYAFPNGHGKGRCYYRLRHLGGDRWELAHDFDYTHDPAHAEQED